MIKPAQLLDLGLAKSEAEVYLILIEHGASQAGKISKKTKLNRTTTYQILDRLVEKGLVSFVQKGKIRIFQATPPKRLLTLQEEKMRLARDLLPELEKLAIPIKEEVTVYQGRKGIRAIMDQILQYKEYVSFGSEGNFLEVMGHDFLLYQKEKRRRKIKSRVILGKISRGKRVVTEAYAKFRFIDNKFATPTTTWIFGDRVAIAVWSETSIAIMIKSKGLADSYRSYFEILWKSASD